MELEHTIKPTDIGKSAIIGNSGEMLYLRPLMGYVMPHDVGKRIYRSNTGTLRVENQEQLQKRLNPS